MIYLLTIKLAEKEGVFMRFAEMVHSKTKDYLSSVSKAERKAIGQFFTPLSIAEYMGTLTRFSGETVRILDPGAGCGILTASIVDSLVLKGIKKFEIDLYENNSSVIPLLESNMCFIKETLFCSGIIFNYQIIEKNFITENHFAWTGMLPSEKYDIVISNPPYKKIGKDSIEAGVMFDIVYGQPNLYFLFMAMGAKLLKRNGEFIYIVPRSFSSGLYFSAFRKWFLSEMKIANLHIFVSREAVAGKHDSILQETVILKAIKTYEKQSKIEITESLDSFCQDTINRYFVDYQVCVRNDENAFLYFPTSKKDAQVLDFVNSWTATLPKLGFRMKTGQLVDFREREWMCETPGSDTVPLLWAFNFNGTRIQFPVQVSGKPQYLKDDLSTKRLQMKRGNYLLLKRFTSKEEKRRLQCALLFDDDFSGFHSLSTENHLNYISKVAGTMQHEEMYGLFVLLNSSYLDKYFRILNGSTQVNANEINSIPFPQIEFIREMGWRAMQYEDIDESICDEIIEEQLAPKQISRAI